jgi:hypothetical protein
VALPSEFTRHVGNQDYLRGIYGLTVDGIVENTIAWKGRRSPVFAFGYAVAGRTEIRNQRPERPEFIQELEKQIIFLP